MLPHVFSELSKRVNKVTYDPLALAQLSLFVFEDAVRVGGWALSWGRGFFRGWVVISALWVVATVLVAKPSTYALLWNAPKYEVAFPSGRKVTVDTSRTHQELVAMV